MKSRGYLFAFKTRTRRGLTLTWLSLFVMSLLMQYGAFAGPASVLANASGDKRLGGFEIDGNLYSGNANPPSLNGDDWAKGATGNGLLTAPTIVDPIGNVDTSNFSVGSKEGDAPSTWQGGTGTASPKDDMGNIFIGSQLTPPGPTGHLWVFAGVERDASNGTTFFDFEFNQKPNVTNSHGISVPNRTAGDVLFVATEQGSSTFTISATVQTWTGSAWGAAVPTNSNNFYGLANDAAIPKGPWADSIATGSPAMIPANQFAEMAFDITSLGVGLHCPSQGFGEVNVRSRSSITDTAALKDYASAPVNIPPNCATLSWAKQDDSGHALGGATFTVTPNPFTGTGAGVTFADTLPASPAPTSTQDQDTRAGFFKLINVVPGVQYTVTEATAPAGYLVDGTSETVGPLAVFQDGTIEYVWKNPPFTHPTLTTALVDGTSAAGKSALQLNLDNTGTSSTFSDSASFGSTNANHKPTGSVTYTLYSNATCTAPAVDSGVAAISAGAIANSKTFTVNGTGTWYVVASYAGDTYNAAATSGCADEAITVVQPNIVAHKSVDKTQAAPGNTLNYTITIQNNGTGDATGVTLSDSISSILAHSTWGANLAASSGSAVYTAGTKTITWTGNIAHGATVTLTFSVALDTVFPIGTTHLLNTVVVVGRGSNCAADSKDITCSTDTTVPAAPILTLEKTVKVDGTSTYSHSATANTGDTLDFQIAVANSGNANATGQTITDVLSADLVANSAAFDITTCNVTCSYNAGTRTITWAGVNINAGASATLTFQVKLNSVFPSGTTHLPNLAVMTGSNCAAGSTDAKCSTDTTVTAAPILTLEKTVKVDGTSTYSHSATANTGDTLDFQIAVANSGNANATGQTITDVLSANLVANSAAFDITTCNVTCSYNAGTRTITWAGVNINAGASATLTFHVKLNAVFPSGSTALDNSVVCPPVNDQPNPACSTTTIVHAAPILNLVKMVKVGDGTYGHTGSANPGDTLTYQLTITNTGDANAAGEAVTDNLSSILAHASWNGDAAASSGSTSFTSPNLTWSGVSIAALGGTATLTFSVTLATTGWTAGTTDLPNTAIEANSVDCSSAGETGPDCSTNNTVTTGTDLHITKAVDPSTIPGGTSTTVTYTLVITNAGNGNTTGNVLVTDNDFPAFYAITGVVCSPTDGTCDSTHLTGSGIDLGSLAAGASVTVTVTGTASPNNTTDVGTRRTNTAYACEQVVEGQPICVHAPATLNVTLTHVPGIHVVKTASTAFLPFPGGPVTYTYAVTNTGNVPLSNVTLTDNKCSPVGFVGGDANTNELLDLTETWTFQCTTSISVDTTNIATATGHDGDTTVTATDTKTVTIGPAPTPTPTPTPTPVSSVLSETATPRITLPPTDAVTPTQQSGNSVFLLLVAIAGLMLLVGLSVPTPARARRRNRRS